jgi:hypothetical protein
MQKDQKLCDVGHGIYTAGRLVFRYGSPDSQKGFPMTKLIILAALGFGVVGFSAFSWQWVAPQPCPEATA